MVDYIFRIFYNSWGNILYELFQYYFILVLFVVFVYIIIVFYFANKKQYVKAKVKISKIKFVFFSILFFILVYLMFLKPFSRGVEIHTLKKVGYEIIEKINHYKTIHGQYPDSISNFLNSPEIISKIFKYKVFKHEDKEIEFFGKESFILEIRPSFMFPEYFYFDERIREFKTTD